MGIRTTLDEVIPLSDPDPEDKLAVWNRRLQIMSCRKTNGNDHFRRGAYDRAIKCYEQGMSTFANEALHLKDELKDEELTRSAEEILVDCCSNLSACFLKLENGPKAMEAVECGLQHAPNHLKLTFRAAKAQLLMSNYTECELWLADAKKISPNDSDCQNLEMQLKRARTKHARDEKKLAQKLVSKQVNWSNAHPESSLPVRLGAAAGNFFYPYLRGAFMGVSIVFVAAAAGFLINYTGGS